MENTLENKSDIVWEKSKFFINRVFIYFSFLFLPVWIQKTLELNLFIQALMMLCYLMFMAGQWYLLGKEIDHRLKIYFRANSSIDRVLYRAVIGNAAMMLIFNVMSFIPDTIVKHFFWGFFISIGLFYSWPTRGKIIEESVSTQFTEYRYLDSFEKTLLFLTIALFLVSMPSFLFINNLETFKMMVDPEEKMNLQIWNFLHMNFYPFKRFPHLVNLGWSMHFYFVSISFYLLAFYGILRFFISRRISMLGLFALVSTWSFSIFLKKDIYTCATTTFSVLWVWSILWCVKSSTYRSGLMYGLLSYFGVVLNYNNIFLYPVGLILLYFYLLRDTTPWYRAQFVKYTTLGTFLILATLMTHLDLNFFEYSMTFPQMKSYLNTVIKRKAFFSLAYIGLLVTLILIFFPSKKIFTTFAIDRKRLIELNILVFALVVVTFLVDDQISRNFGLLWYVVFLSVLPLEWIFQSLSRRRSHRNFIYVVYVIICLLDSHFEGRVRIVYNFFQSPPDIIEVLNRQ